MKESVHTNMFIQHNAFSRHFCIRVELLVVPEINEILKLYQPSEMAATGPGDVYAALSADDEEVQRPMEIESMCMQCEDNVSEEKEKTDGIPLMIRVSLVSCVSVSRTTRQSFSCHSSVNTADFTTMRSRVERLFRYGEKNILIKLRL